MRRRLSCRWDWGERATRTPPTCTPNQNTQIDSSKYEVVEYVPALAKIFDEILVNVADNYHRSFEVAGGEKATTQMQVWIDREKGTVSIKNDGKCIDVAMHPTAGIYCPELVFGNFQAGSNFDDTQKRITGGRNGIGAKAANVLSDVFTIAIGDSEHRKEYQQEWRHSMAEMGSPIITEGYRGSDYTQVTFTPHYDYFGMDGLDEAHEDLFFRRVADVAACCRGLSVTLNNQKLVHSFVDYVEARYRAIENTADAVTHDEEETEATDADEDEDGEEKAPHRYVHSASLKHSGTGLPWEVCVGPGNPGDSLDLSFVNAINTTEHGTHFNIMQMQVVGAFRSHILLEYGYDLPVSFVRDRVRVFVNCLVENPEFNGQCKARLTHPSLASLRNDVQLPQDFLKQICEDDAILQPIVTAWALKTQIEGSGVKRRAKPFAEKLEDAKKAGTRESRDCTLILVEGDSAKSLAVAGLQSLQRDYWGVYPLRGKLMNVKKRRTLKSELSNLDKLESVLGLDREKTYETEEELDTLRYGSIAVMTDQDPDGSHIKGLIISWLSHYWPLLLKKPLLKVNGSSVPYLRSIVTPLVKVFTEKPKAEHWFYSLPEYTRWQAKYEGRFRAKYYKGLGSSTSAEGREYFARLFNTDRPMLINFEDISEKDVDSIEDAFGDDADRRKVWLRDHRSRALDTSTGEVSINEFVNTDVASYFHYINLERALPSCIDGLKPSQRKVLHTCFHRDLSGHKEMKVSQLSGAVAELTCYHHGDMSMHETIVKLAQDFVGSGNNVPLLEPLGQFGTRLAGGSDHASARYISTRLSPLVRFLFREEDDALLERRTEEGRTVEPVTFVPIIPMVLVNGALGIGGGYSCKVNSYDPLAVVSVTWDLISMDEVSYTKLTNAVKVLRKQCDTVNVKELRQRFLTERRKTVEHALLGDDIIPQNDPNWQVCFEKEKAHRKELNAMKAESMKFPTDNMPETLKPWYQGHKGLGAKTHIVSGKDLRILELPVGEWTDSFKKFLHEQKKKGLILRFSSVCTDSEVDITITFKDLLASTRAPVMRRIAKGFGEDRMTFINTDGHVHRFEHYLSLFTEYIPIRRDLYQKRKNVYAEARREEIEKLSAFLLFRQSLVDGSIKMTDGLDYIIEFMQERGVADAAVTRRLYSYSTLAALGRGSEIKEKELENEQEALRDMLGKSVNCLWKEDLLDFVRAYVAHHKLSKETAIERLGVYSGIGEVLEY